MALKVGMAPQVLFCTQMSQLDLGDWLSKNQRRKGGLSLGSIKQVSSGCLCSHSCRYLPINKCGVLRGCAVSLKNKNRNCRLLCWQHFYIIDVCKKLKKKNSWCGLWVQGCFLLFASQGNCVKGQEKPQCHSKRLKTDKLDLLH